MVGAIVQAVSIASAIASKVGGDVNKSRVSKDLQAKAAKGQMRGHTIRTSNVNYTGKGLADALTGNRSYFD